MNQGKNPEKISYIYTKNGMGLILKKKVLNFSHIRKKVVYLKCRAIEKPETQKKIIYFII